ncbi:MAG: helix-turn-helix domain-containing protein [Bacteriovoracaceae bacterium]|nr:helix-turn-helix domain-containing protein [Bacteriovoracaceae bacterium]
MNTKKLIPHLEKDLGEMSFGMFLRVTRKSMELTQVDMAKKLKISRGTLCDIEKGRQLVSPKLAFQIAKTCKFPEVIAVQLAIQDQLKKANLKFKVNLAA